MILEISNKDAVINSAFKTLLDNTNDLIFIKDSNLTYVYASLPFIRMTGHKYLEDIIGKTDLEIFEDKNLAIRYVYDDNRLLSGKRNLISYTEPIPDENGGARYGTTSKYILYDNDEQIIGLLGITRDITREYLSRQRYQQELKYLFKLPESTYAVCYIDIDSWRVISQRRQLIDGCTLQNCNTMEELCQFAVDSITDKNCKAYEFYNNFNAEMLKEIYKSGRNDISFSYKRCLSEDVSRWVHNDIRFIMDVDSGHLCAMLSAKDIEKEKQEEHNLLISAKMDRMTMLLNRETTMEYIKNILEDESESGHALFMFDVDNFKKLNDTLGHQEGDRFLITLAKVLKKSFRESDVVGRIGGDEFFVLLKNVSSPATAEKKAEELFVSMQKVCDEYPEIPLSLSIGISMYPENGQTVEELYKKSDDALYYAKRKGKNQFIFAENEDKQ